MVLKRGPIRGSNPAHGDAKRKSAVTQSAEVFALPLWVGRAPRGLAQRFYFNAYTDRASPTAFGTIRRPPAKSATTNPTKAAADIQTPGGFDWSHQKPDPERHQRQHQRCESILVRKKSVSDRGGLVAEDHEVEHLQKIATRDPNDVQDFGPTLCTMHEELNVTRPRSDHWMHHF